MNDFNNTDAAAAPKFNTSGPARISPSTEATQKSTFTPEDDASLSNVQRAGCTQVVAESTCMSVRASSEQEFSEDVSITNASGLAVHDVSKVKSSDRIQIGDLFISYGAGLNMGLIKNVGGEVVLTSEGTQMLAQRAGKKLESIETNEMPSIHSPNAAASIKKLDGMTRGSFSKFLPQALAAHIANKPMDHEMLKHISDTSGLDQDFLLGLVTQISQESLDKGSRAVGALEGLSGSAVFKLVQDSSPNTQRLYLTACAMGDAKGARDIIKAIRRRDIS